MRTPTSNSSVPCGRCLKRSPPAALLNRGAMGESGASRRLPQEGHCDPNCRLNLLLHVASPEGRRRGGGLAPPSQGRQPSAGRATLACRVGDAGHRGSPVPTARRCLRVAEAAMLDVISDRLQSAHISSCSRTAPAHLSVSTGRFGRRAHATEAPRETQDMAGRVRRGPG